MADTPRPWWGEFLCAGTSAVFAICCTNPVDVVKTRMVLQGQMNQGASPYRGVGSALLQIGRAEGLRGLQRGLGPACFWQFSNVSVRFGVYGAAKQVAGVGKETPPLQRWIQSLGLAGISGGLGALVSNPFFIVKTRLQATSGDTALAVGQQHEPTSGVWAALRDMYRTDGAAGLTRGLSAFAPRVIVASAVQLATYDSVKDWLVRRLGLEPRATATHVCASMITGAAVVVAMQPFDFAATRLVNTLTRAEQQAQAVAAAAGAGGGKAPAVFTGPLDVIRKTVATEGIFGVYKGVTANYLRFGPYCILVFVFVEKLRDLEATALRRWR